MAHKALTTAHFSYASQDCRSEVQVLIVQRNELLARSLARYLGAHYVRALVVSTAAEAESVLRSTTSLLHVVCGQVLGDGEPSGATCIGRWRAEFPHVTRAILATGSDEPIGSAAGVDGVFLKPSEPRDLMALLQAPALSTPRTDLQAAATHKDIMNANKTKAHDLKTLKERAAVAAASKAGQSAQPKVAQGFTVV